MITSAEEAVVLQKRTSARNRFFWNIEQPEKSSVDNYGRSKKRDVGEIVVVSY
jgi:hypothetical protein